MQRFVQVCIVHKLRPCPPMLQSSMLRPNADSPCATLTCAMLALKFYACFPSVMLCCLTATFAEQAMCYLHCILLRLLHIKLQWEHSIKQPASQHMLSLLCISTASKACSHRLKTHHSSLYCCLQPSAISTQTLASWVNSNLLCQHARLPAEHSADRVLMSEPRGVPQYWAACITQAQEPNPLSSRDGRHLKPVPKQWKLTQLALTQRLQEAMQKLHSMQVGLLLTAWAGSKQPDKASLALMRGFAYVQAGRHEQALKVNRHSKPFRTHLDGS